MNLNAQQNVSAQAYQELLRILRKPYQDVCLTCQGSGKLASRQECASCKGSGNRWLRLI
ncbi:MAG: hypothetical protein R3332_11000 [Pseudohongiellaceae bacterium]|nr:hypothetical protein [Pseudohongiellaceae bacterium]